MNHPQHLPAAATPAPFLSLHAFTAPSRKGSPGRPIDLDVVKGELVCLLGPAACGNSQLLRVIAGEARPGSGQLDLDGRDVGRLPPAARGMALWATPDSLVPVLNVRRNVRLGLVGSDGEAAARVEALLAQVGLNGLGGRFPASLTPALRRRVTLARALVRSPRLLLADEPLAGLDGEDKIALRVLLRERQQQQGLTTIVALRDPLDAMAMADRIAVMEEGMVAQIGTPQQVYCNPASEYVARLIGQGNWLPAVTLGAGMALVGDMALMLRQQRYLPPGTRIKLFIRPENVRLLHEWRPQQNNLLCHIEAMDFLGPTVRVRLKPSSMRGTRVVAELNPLDVQRLGIRVGMLAPLALPSDCIQVFGDGGAWPQG
ncbi:ABC transporter ATP-binding protein [Chitinivorax sp. PXF-14]|uniref:ABC transporter ATP-binding protein n=1 Tax=Chitinivorax sp. PXF-14 TaxID=3230488 RepID=UPI00346781A0